MAGLTQPLEFRKFISCTPKAGFDFVPFLDAMLIALFVALNASPFVIAPGTAINLPRSSAHFVPQSSPTAVLTVGQNQLYFFEGAKLSSLNLQKRLTEYVQDIHAGSARSQPILLIKADGNIPTRLLFHLMDLAGAAGFSQIQLAAEPATAESKGQWGQTYREEQP